jgi:hypothetical protein
VKRGVREPLRHTQGEGAGDPIGSPVPFLAFDLSATIGGIMADNASPLNSELITLAGNVQMVDHLDRISMELSSAAAPVALEEHGKALIADRELALAR